jgi:hypothetical protein
MSNGRVKLSIYSGPKVEVDYQISAAVIEVEGRITRSKTGSLKLISLPNTDKLGIAILPLTEAAKKDAMKTRKRMMNKDKTREPTSVSGEEVIEKEKDKTIPTPAPIKIVPYSEDQFDPDKAGTELDTHKETFDTQYMLPTVNSDASNQVDPGAMDTVNEVYPTVQEEGKNNTGLEENATLSTINTTPLQNVVTLSEPLLNFPGALVGLYNKDKFFRLLAGI